MKTTLDTIDVVRDTLALLKKHPQMFLVEQNFKSLEAFLIGYFFGIKDAEGIGFNGKLSEWHNRNTQKKSSLYWTRYVLHILADDDEEKASRMLFEHIDEFLKDYENNPF
jgi:hypothetical protein